MRWYIRIGTSSVLSLAVEATAGEPTSAASAATTRSLGQKDIDAFLDWRTCRRRETVSSTGQGLDFATIRHLRAIRRGVTLPILQPLDANVDHVRGPEAARLILEYGDYECPYSRLAFRQIQRVERELPGGVRFAFRHFPLPSIPPHALAAAAAAEAASRQGRFWEMHELLYHRQKALQDDDLRGYAAELGLDTSRFDEDWIDDGVIGRVRRDVD